jgi:hypothetical protein
MADHCRPPEALTAYTAGQSLAERGEHEQARLALGEAVRIDPGFAEAQAALGAVYAKLGDAHRARLHSSFGKWLQHRATLERCRARPAERRTTPPAVVDVASLFPELASLRSITVRLHPRYGEEPPRWASKLGGTLLWPALEPWPTCPAHGIPFVGVLQLRADDFPEMPFPPAADLFQVLWCPREHDSWPMCWANPRFFWRNAAAIHDPLPANPPLTEPYYEYVPFPCRLMPERVTEFPSVYELPDELAEQIAAWEDQHLGPDGTHTVEYEADLSVCPGTKVGGHLDVIQSLWVPTCKCGRLMDHVLTIATTEWGGLVDRRWTPLEEQHLFALLPSLAKEWVDSAHDVRAALWNATGLQLGDSGHMQLFVCRHCPHWPIEPAIECC